jgi:hypothetical protein
MKPSAGFPVSLFTLPLARQSLSQCPACRHLARDVAELAVQQLDGTERNLNLNFRQIDLDNLACGNTTVDNHYLMPRISNLRLARSGLRRKTTRQSDNTHCLKVGGPSFAATRLCLGPRLCEVWGRSGCLAA